MKNILITFSAIILSLLVGCSERKVNDNTSSDYKVSSNRDSLIKDSISIENQISELAKDTIDNRKVDSLKVDSLKSELSVIKAKIDKLDNNKFESSDEAGYENPFFNWDTLLLLALCLVNLLIIIYLTIDKKKRRDEILYHLTGIKKSNKQQSRVITWKNEIIEATEKRIIPRLNLNQSSSVNASDFDRAIDELKNRIVKLEDMDRNFSTVSNARNENTLVSAPSLSASKTLYADAIIEGMFNKITELPNVDTIYELLLPSASDTTATFRIYDEATRRVLRNTDFIDGCDKQRIDHTPTELEVERGEAQLLDNGKWKITKKAIVKLV